MRPESVLLIVTLAAVCILLLVVMVATRKARRDRRESEKTRRRARFVAGLSGPRVEQSGVLAEATGNAGAQTDLVAVLTTGRGGRADLRSLEAYGALARDLIARLSARSPVQRGTAVLLLNLFEDDAGVPAATAALGDRDADVRLVAARSLSLVATAESARVLLSALRDGRLPAERLIERLSGPWALTPCLDALAAESGATAAKDSRFRANVARALTLIGDSRAEGLLLAMLLTTGQAEERVNAARALGRCGTDACLPALADALTDPEPNVRVQAAKALGGIGSVDSVPALTAAMADPTWWVRSNAATALGELGDAGRDALREVAAGTDRFAAQRAAEQLVLLEHR